MLSHLSRIPEAALLYVSSIVESIGACLERLDVPVVLLEEEAERRVQPVVRLLRDLLNLTRSIMRAYGDPLKRAEDQDSPTGAISEFAGFFTRWADELVAEDMPGIRERLKEAKPNQLDEAELLDELARRMGVPREKVDKAVSLLK